MRIHVVVAAFAAVQIGFCNILFDGGPGLLQLAGRNAEPVQLLCAENEYDGVSRAAGDLALDFGRVVGVNGTLSQGGNVSSPDNDALIIIGTLGHSTIIDQLVEQGTLNVSEIEGHWESYIQQVVKDPIQGVSNALVIAGSDKRGSIYGVYDISKTIGVSPWYFWASIPSNARYAVFVDPERVKVQTSPSVKYRGIFINDEWDLMSWAEDKFPQSSHSDTHFTHEFYSLVFELLLRLRANYLWPAMKGDAAFYADDPLNGQLADRYGIIMGTSHHEPMARAYNEQSEISGPWDWSENSQEITKFMKSGVERAKGWETMWTMGMRGDGDRESPTLTAPQLEEVIQIQQEMLVEATGKEVDEIPQAWMLYKEVGKYWQAGMNISEHVTLMWTDDNFGNLNRIPLANETDRIGGHGIYYHFGYVGEPRSYEWISTIQMVKTWEQMHLAYEKGARSIWVTNVQDIKPHALSIQHFLDMAYDMSHFQDPGSTTEWLRRWAIENFGASDEIAVAVGDIVNMYGRLVLRRKYETLNILPFAFSTLNYDEAESVLREWQDLATLAWQTHDALDPQVQDAFWLLFVYPAEAGKHVFEVYISAAYGFVYRAQGRASTNQKSLQAMAAFVADNVTENAYNTRFNGQWDHFVQHARMGYEGIHAPGDPYGPNYLPPLAWHNCDSIKHNKNVGVAVSGLNSSSIFTDEALILPVIDQSPPSRSRPYIDVFAAVNGSFPYVVTSNSSFVKLDPSSGILTSPGKESDIRVALAVDWKTAPEEPTWVALDVSSESSTVAEVLVLVSKTTVPSNFTGWVEANGVVSINPARWSHAETTEGVSYVELPWYGKTASGVKLWPVTVDSQDISSGPKLQYNFFVFSDVDDALLIIYLGGSLDHDPTRPLKLGYALGSDTAKEVRLFEDYPAGGHPADWSPSVVNGGWNVTVDISVSKGANSLNLWLLEPGVVVEKIVMDLGGMKESFLGPPESLYIS
ncbi:hypothetical protein ASPVEDRAFT_712718 [Aspergillus versicolor CBS 583.65]|uniref:Gylcosyl hydrolase 115 C-terminal domain-containing protein n=1 Tax=Aspergillus versicolor CBS 583.65 TaxID=1036611 RepID=A0A1L9PNB8_ASPVE|nr:uncharacterized protein ASPVEDRAFT_712718 [Aspergillus versicolor CBS 583.65]OJJ03018.1 hypothetical protein ASPVEDRAFT_712718 [Aspergillus versicolor CBS 583.65]